MRVLVLLLVIGAAVSEAGPKKRPKPKVAVASAPVAVAAPAFVMVYPATTTNEALNELLPAATAQLRAALSRYAVELAPEGTNEAPEAARARRAEGFGLQVVLSTSGEGLRVGLLVTSWPNQGLRGSWDTTASGPPPAELLEAALPRSLDDAAGDLGWSKR